MDKNDLKNSLKGVNWINVVMAGIFAVATTVVSNVTGQQKDNKLNTLWDEYQKNQK